MPKWINNKCDVCGKKVQNNAELCSSCRGPFEYIKNKYPDKSQEVWKELTINLIADRREKREIRRMGIKNNDNN